MIGWGIARITPEQFPPCYALLQEAFAADELNSAAEILADLSVPLSAESPEQYVMLARWAELSGAVGRTGEGRLGAVASLISGCYLALEEPRFAGQGVGFIEYLATSAAQRGQGHAGALLAALEAEFMRIANNRRDRLRLIIGEIGPELVAFKLRRGYRQPPGSRYTQPPIAFDPRTGQPLSPALPKILMVKDMEAGAGAELPAAELPVETDLLLHAVRTIFARRYLPKRLSPQAARRAWAYIEEQALRPFAASLQGAI
jgi:hypothetical protein